MKEYNLIKTMVNRKVYIAKDIHCRGMLTYRNDPLLFDKASQPKDYITLKDLADNRDLIFLKGNILNLYSALVKKKDFKRKR